MTAGSDHNASVWEVGGSRKILPDLKHGDAVMSAEFSPDGLMILTACLDGSARLWDADSMRPVDLNPILRHSSRLLHAAFAPDGHRIVTACVDGTAYLWDFAGSNARPVTFTGAVSQDGTRLLLKDKDSFRVLDSASLKSIMSTVQVELPLVEARLSPSGRFALTVTAEEKGTNSLNTLVHVWDCSSGSAISPPITLTNRTARLSVSDDGQQLVMSTDEGAQLWSVPEGKPAGSGMVHDAPVTGTALSSDGRRLALFGGNLVSLWDTSSRRRVCEPLRHPLPVSLAEFSPDSHSIVTACRDKQLTHPAVLQFAGFSSDGDELVTADKSGHIWWWDLRPEQRPIEDLLLLSQLLSGFQSTSSKLPSLRTQGERRRVWERLRYGYPDDVAVSHEEILAWHSRYAHASQSERHWAASVFHLNQLVRLGSHDAALSDQLKQAQKSLTEEERR